MFGASDFFEKHGNKSTELQAELDAGKENVDAPV